MSSEQPTDKRLHPFCKVCGWRKGGIDSWDGTKCKCGHSEPPLEKGWVVDGFVFEDLIEADRTYRASRSKTAKE